MIDTPATATLYASWQRSAVPFFPSWIRTAAGSAECGFQKRHHPVDGRRSHRLEGHDTVGVPFQDHGLLSSHPGGVLEEVAVPFEADRTPAILRDHRLPALTDDFRISRRHAVITLTS